MKLTSSEQKTLLKRYPIKTQESFKHDGMFEASSDLIPQLVALGESESEAELNLEKILFEEVGGKRSCFEFALN